MNEVYEAVKERVRMADAWSKSTGYPQHDYFDVMMDLRRMLAIWESRATEHSAELEKVRGELAEAKNHIKGLEADVFVGAKIDSLEVTGFMNKLTAERDAALKREGEAMMAFREVVTRLNQLASSESLAVLKFAAWAEAQYIIITLPSKESK